MVHMERLEDLDAVLMDPQLKRTLGHAKLYNELLLDQPLTETEITEFVNEIDQEWLHLIGENAVMTGYATFADENDHSEGPSLIRSYYENQDIVFRGILARKINDAISEFGGVDTANARAFYQLRLGIAREGLDAEANHLEMYGSSAIDEVFSLEFEDIMSPERARRWLEYYYPHIIHDIDYSMLNLNTEDECELIMSLQDFEWNLSSQQEHINDEGFIKKTKGAFQIYTSSLFSFDGYVGYGLLADGEAWLERADESVPIEFNAAAIASIISVQLEESPTDDDYVVRPHLRVMLHDEDKDGMPLSMVLPLCSIDDLSSIRSNFYSQFEETDTVEN